jgi:hypothetical protein
LLSFQLAAARMAGLPLHSQEVTSIAAGG